MQYYRVHCRLRIALITVTSIMINVVTCELLFCNASVRSSILGLDNGLCEGKKKYADCSVSRNILFIFTT